MGGMTHFVDIEFVGCGWGGNHIFVWIHIERIDVFFILVMCKLVGRCIDMGMFGEAV